MRFERHGDAQNAVTSADGRRTASNGLQIKPALAEAAIHRLIPQIRDLMFVCVVKTIGTTEGVD